jgi:hypothetical protein
VDRVDDISLVAVDIEFTRNQRAQGGGAGGGGGQQGDEGLEAVWFAF